MHIWHLVLVLNVQRVLKVTNVFIVFIDFNQWNVKNNTHTHKALTRLLFIGNYVFFNF